MVAFAQTDPSMAFGTPNGTCDVRLLRQYGTEIHQIKCKTSTVGQATKKQFGPKSAEVAVALGMLFEKGASKETVKNCKQHLLGLEEFHELWQETEAAKQ